MGLSFQEKWALRTHLEEPIHGWLTYATRASFGEWRIALEAGAGARAHDIRNCSRPAQAEMLRRWVTVRIRGFARPCLARYPR